MFKKMMFFLVMNWALAAAGQELTITAAPSTLSVLPGAPLPVTLTVTNTSGRDLWIVGETLQRGIALREASLVRANNKRPPCETYSSDGLQAASSAPPSIWPKVLFERGATYSLQSGIYSQNTCPLEAVPPGLYRGKLAVRCRLIAQTGLKEITASAEIAVDVRAPSGQDLAFLQALKRVLAASDATAPSGSANQAKPLEWGEVLSSRRLHPGQIALKDFPTSTYAGYVLAQKTAGLSMQALACLDNPEGTLRGWGDRGGGEANTLGHIKEAQEAMREYAKAAGPFLEAHPDFVQAPLIRRQYAMCLGLTGHMPEALSQVRQLEKAEGKEGQEAKLYLESLEKKSAAPSAKP